MILQATMGRLDCFSVVSARAIPLVFGYQLLLECLFGDYGIGECLKK